MMKSSNALFSTRIEPGKAMLQLQISGNEAARLYRSTFPTCATGKMVELAIIADRSMTLLEILALLNCSHVVDKFDRVHAMSCVELDIGLTFTTLH
jgi:hypothetical protein